MCSNAVRNYLKVPQFLSSVHTSNIHFGHSYEFDANSNSMFIVLSFHLRQTLGAPNRKSRKLQSLKCDMLLLME